MRLLIVRHNQRFDHNWNNPGWRILQIDLLKGDFRAFELNFYNRLLVPGSPVFYDESKAYLGELEKEAFGSGTVGPTKWQNFRSFSPVKLKFALALYEAVPYELVSSLAERFNQKAYSWWAGHRGTVLGFYMAEYTWPFIYIQRCRPNVYNGKAAYLLRIANKRPVAKKKISRLSKGLAQKCKIPFEDRLQNYYDRWLSLFFNGETIWKQLPLKLPFRTEWFPLYENKQH